jgi:hypothetical protein
MLQNIREDFNKDSKTLRELFEGKFEKINDFYETGYNTYKTDDKKFISYYDD